MPANVETMMFAGETPWHGIGTQVDTEQTGEKALVLSGLDWAVELCPAFASYNGQSVLVPDCKAVVRSKDSTVLGMVGDRYVPIQNAEMAAFAESIVGVGGAHFHTMGALNNGRMAWALLKLSAEMRIIGDDTLERYLLVYNSHDGSKALSALITSVRVVCQNTLNQAVRGAKNAVSIRHTKNATSKVAEAQRILGFANKHFEKFETTCQAMTQMEYNSARMAQLLDACFPKKEGEESSSTRSENNRNKVIELFDSGKGMDLPGVRGTAWAAYNAVTEYADHFQSTRVSEGADVRELRFQKNLFGSGAALKQVAFDTIVTQMTSLAA